jgi:hypothetical protein
MATFTFNTTRHPRSGKRERLTVGAAAVNITASVYTIAGSGGAAEGQGVGYLPKLATAAVIQVIDGPIYWTIDGSTPSSTVGFQNDTGDFIYLDSAQKVKEFKAIRASADVTIEVLALWGA